MDHHHEHDHVHDHHDHDHRGHNETLKFDGFVMTPLLQAKLITMSILCIVSFILGVLPIKLHQLLRIKVPSTHSHSSNSEQPLLMSLLLCFGGGVLLFTTFLHLQPEVRENMQHLIAEGALPSFVTKNNLQFADLVFCAGFFLVYIIEEVVHFFLDLSTNHHEDEAVLHRTMSLRKCTKHSYNYARNKGTMIPRVSLGHNAHKPDVPDSSLLSVSTTSRQVLIDNVNSGNSRRVPPHHVAVDTLPRISTTTSSTDAETESSAGSCHDSNAKKSFRGLFAILALSFHEIFEGLAVGLDKNIDNVWYLFAAIATHKFVLSFCLGVELVSTKTKIPVIVLYLCTFALVTPIGISIGIMLLMSDQPGDIPEGTLITVILQGIAAGTLLYVTFFEILQREKANTKCGILQLLSIVLGFGFMLCMQFFTVPHSHSHVHHQHNHR